MKSVLALVALLAASVAAQASPPACTLKCIGTDVGCDITQKSCQCDPKTQEALAPCVEKECTDPKDLAAAKAFAEANCAGFTPSGSAGAEPVAPTEEPAETATATETAVVTGTEGEVVSTATATATITGTDLGEPVAPTGGAAETTLVPSGTNETASATGTEAAPTEATGAAGKAAVAGSAVLAAIFALVL